MDEPVQVEKEKEELISQKTEEEKPVEKTADVSPERIERMKKAFRPTWIQDQINSSGKTLNGKK